MISWLEPVIPHLKALHVIALALWVGGLFGLPVMLARHDPAIGQADYTRIRLASHVSYVWIITPAAVTAIVAGTWLIFLREVFTVWMFAKLVFVALLIGFHAWIGHHIVKVGESDGRHQTPRPIGPLLILLVPVLVILTLVLLKPELEEIPMPDWLTQPRERQLPVSEVPRW
ncbi:membrane protein [Paracoccus acridae]|uniref:Protoporphyrinogen IX oxidase n=1 Tax=Paracoccus acridae TaxID=1795310 RepID=A0ABQ1VLN4_9RHOB|nr:CopD family protein [Paracoccus acridae]GGF76117.1 membrane protein [Paracoccus acridae]